MSPPHAIYTPDPEYSKEARDAHFEGRCVLWVVIGTDGRVRDVKVKQSLGKGLDQKAVEAVSRWRFKPALKGGEPVPVQVNVEVNFRLYDSLSASLTSLREKANRGDAKSQLKLAKILLKGREVPKDETEGLAWLRLAADHGLPDAQFEMGEYLATSTNNPSDYVTAYMWYAIARRNGYKHADKGVRELAAKLSPEQLSDAENRAQHWVPTAKP